MSIADVLRLFHGPGEYFEIRALKPKPGRFGTMTGYFNDVAAAAAAIKELDGGYEGVYFLLNPIDPALNSALEARGEGINRMSKAQQGESTSDADICRLRWLLLDFDPVRIKGVSATDDEKECAKALAHAVVEDLTARGWPEPLRADSGNGYHALYRIDLPNDAASRGLLKGVLQALAERHDTAGAKVDRSTFNPARITKAYGSLAAKGKSTSERPHRRSGIRGASASLEAVSREQLGALAPEPEPRTHAKKTRSKTWVGEDGTFSSEEWLTKFFARHSITPRNERVKDGFTLYDVVCPWNADHGAGGESTVMIHPSGAYVYKCLHSSCTERRWEDYREHYEPGYQAHRESGRSGNGDPRGARWEPGAAPGTEGADEDWQAPIPLRIVDVPPFPVEALPDDLRAHVESVALATQTPADLCALVVLAVLGTTVAKRGVIRINGGWREPLNLYTVPVLGPGNRKTEVFREATAPLTEFQAEEELRLARDVKLSKARRVVAEKALERAQAEAAKATAVELAEKLQAVARLVVELAELPVVTSPRLWADDVTPEKLAVLMAENGGRMAVLSAEGGIFGTLAGRYQANGGVNIDLFNKGHSGDDVAVDRIGRESFHIKGPAISVGLAVQPDVLRATSDTPEFRGRGFLARFLYALPESLVGDREINACPMPDHVRRRYAAIVRELLALEPARNGVGEIVPHVLTVSPDAEEALYAFCRWLEPQLRESGELALVVDWAAKLAGAVARIAGLLHLAEHADERRPWGIPVSVETMERALTIGRYFIPHARAAFAQMGSGTLIDDAGHLLGWIRRKRPQDLYPAGPLQRDVRTVRKGRGPRPPPPAARGPRLHSGAAAPASRPPWRATAEPALRSQPGYLPAQPAQRAQPPPQTPPEEVLQVLQVLQRGQPSPKGGAPTPRSPPRMTPTPPPRTPRPPPGRPRGPGGAGGGRRRRGGAGPVTSAIAELVRTIESRGVTLREKAGAVVARPAGKVTPAERAALGVHKEAVLTILRQRQAQEVLGIDWTRVELRNLDRILEVAVPWSDTHLLIVPGCKVAKELRASDPQPGRIWCVCEILDLLLTNVSPREAQSLAEARLMFDADLGGVAGPEGFAPPVPIGCTQCGEFHEGGLYANVGEGRFLCAACWNSTGRPGYTDTPQKKARSGS